MRSIPVRPHTVQLKDSDTLTSPTTISRLQELAVQLLLAFFDKNSLFQGRIVPKCHLGVKENETTIELGWVAVLRLFRDIGWDKLGAALSEINFPFPRHKSWRGVTTTSCGCAFL